MRRKTRIASIVIATLLLAGTAAYAATCGTPFSKTGRTSYQVPKSKEGFLIVNGVDVSVFQTRRGKDYLSDVKWGSLKTAGVDVAIIRAGGTHARKKNKKYEYYKDVSLKDHYNKATKAGMMIGVYWLAQSMNKEDAITEADKAVSYLKANGIEPKDLALPVYMDYEFVSGKEIAMTPSTLTQAKGTAAAKAFCARIESYGYKSGIYASTSFYNRYIDASKLDSSTSLWVAQYYSKCEYTKHDFDMWQYSSSGKISGMFYDFSKNPIDCNFLYLNKSRSSKSGSDIGSCTVKVNKYSSYISRGTQHKTAVVVKNVNGETLKAGRDYEVSYLKNTCTGTAYVCVRGVGTYKGYKLASFSIQSNILDKFSMSGAKDKLTFSEGSGLALSSDSRIISGIPADTAVSDLSKLITLPAGCRMDVRTLAGKAVKTGTLKTGLYLCIYDEDDITIGVAALAVEGDLNGDGEMTAADIDTFAQAVVGKKNLTQVQLSAAKVEKADLKSLADLISMLNGDSPRDDESVDKATSTEGPMNDDLTDNVEMRESGTSIDNTESADADNASDTSGNLGASDVHEMSDEEGNQFPDSEESGGDNGADAAECSASEENSAAKNVITNDEDNSSSVIESEDVSKAPDESEPVEEPRTELAAEMSHTSIYRGQTVDCNVKINNVNGPAALITVNPGKYAACVDVSTTGNCFYKGKLVVYSVDGSPLRGKLRFCGKTAGKAKVLLTGKIILADDRFLDFGDSASVSVKSAAAPRIRKLKSAKRGFKVTWAKRDKAPFSGYQIRYSRKSSMKSAKTITVKSSSALSKQIKGLKRRKRYYIQVRGYIGSTSYATGWSSRRSVKAR